MNIYSIISGSTLLSYLTIIWLIIFFIFIIREIALWYWKINRIVALLEKIEKNTRKNILEVREDDEEESTDLLKTELFK